MGYKLICTNILSLGLLSSASTTIAQMQQPKQKSTPNLVFIMADQYRGDAIGCIGKEPVKTPLS